MQAVLANLQKELGITFVYVTHSMSEAFSMADRVVIMSRGQIEQIGTPEEIYREPYNRFVAEFLGSANIFDGTVQGPAGDDGWDISYEGGTTILPRSELTDAKQGQSVTFIVSAENMQLSLPGSGQAGIEASVAGEEFVGGTAMVFLETSLGQEIKVQNRMTNCRRSTCTQDRRSSFIGLQKAAMCFLVKQADNTLPTNVGSIELSQV